LYTDSVPALRGLVEAGVIGAGVFAVDDCKARYAEPSSSSASPRR
jgi:hypothetical protein